MVATRDALTKQPTCQHPDIVTVDPNEATPAIEMTDPVNVAVVRNMSEVGTVLPVEQR